MVLASLARSVLTAIAPTPVRAVRVFVAANIAFLGLDIYIAHLANEFAHRTEWAPIVFSAVATPLLVPGALGSTRPVARHLDRVVGLASIVVGVLGMVFHLESGFFEKQTLHDLVYAAPFVAPLSYVGVGLLGLLVHSADAGTPRLGPWVILLALGGFVGNFVLSVLDHAQNGFFHVTEWIPVASAAYAITFLIAFVARPSSVLVRACVVVLGLQVAVALGGAALHVNANLHASAMTSFRDRFVFGAPAFAPLLFANLAVLALIGLWASPTQPQSPGLKTIG